MAAPHSGRDCRQSYVTSFEQISSSLGIRRAAPSTLRADVHRASEKNDRAGAGLSAIHRDGAYRGVSAPAVRRPACRVKIGPSRSRAMAALAVSRQHGCHRSASRSRVRISAGALMFSKDFAGLLGNLRCASSSESATSRQNLSEPVTIRVGRGWCGLGCGSVGVVSSAWTSTLGRRAHGRRLTRR